MNNCTNCISNGFSNIAISTSSLIYCATVFSFDIGKAPNSINERTIALSCGSSFFAVTTSCGAGLVTAACKACSWSISAAGAFESFFSFERIALLTSCKTCASLTSIRLENSRTYSARTNVSGTFANKAIISRTTSALR